MAMKIEKTLCPYCGAALKMRPGQKQVFCEYCKSSVLITDSDGTAPGKEPDFSLFQDPAGPQADYAMGGHPAGNPTAASHTENAAGRRRRQALFPPPGFRSGNIVHMLLAGIGYLFLLFIAIELDTFLDSIFFLIASLTVVDLCTDWTGFYSGLKGIHSPNPVIRILMKIFWGFLLFTAWILVLAILQSLFG